MTLLAHATAIDDAALALVEAVKEARANPAFEAYLGAYLGNDYGAALALAVKHSDTAPVKGILAAAVPQ